MGHGASQLDAANWCSAREHLNSFQLIQAVAVFLVLHRSFAAWAVGGLLRESQQFSPIRSQTLMPSFVFLCCRQCSTEPPSQPRRPATRRGIFFREFRFPLLRFLRFRFSVTVMFLAFYTDIESSRVEQQQQQHRRFSHLRWPLQSLAFFSYLMAVLLRNRRQVDSDHRIRVLIVW